MEQVVDYETAKELQAAGFPWTYWEKQPTALEILEQMPPMTSISKNYFGVWECSFALAMYQTDYRADPCPHKAAALAYIAWKKGME